MKHKTRILADRLIAVPTSFVFNGVARVLGRLLRRDHSITPENVRSIAVAKLIGMGSILQATPLLRALKHTYPNAKLTFVTMRSNRELLGRLEWVDEVLALDDRSVFVMAATTLAIVARLIRRRIDLYFDLEVYSAFASLLALWAVTRNRIGFYRYSVTFKEGIYTHLVYFNTRMPVRQLYLQLGRVAGVPSGQSQLTGPIPVDEQSRRAVRRMLYEEGGWPDGQSYVVINPNASDLLLERRWPVENTIEAVKRLVSLGQKVVLMGARDEVPFVQSLFDRLEPCVQSHVINTAGRLTLGELFALLEGAACVVTNDTGPMHMAIALQRPTVCLFGPANPEHYGQNLPYVQTIYGRVFCSPCIYETDQPPCNGDNICMKRIEPRSVVDAVQRLIDPSAQDRSSFPSGSLNSLPVMMDGPEGQPLGVIVRASVQGAATRES